MGALSFKAPQLQKRFRFTQGSAEQRAWCGGKSAGDRESAVPFAVLSRALNRWCFPVGRGGGCLRWGVTPSPSSVSVAELLHPFGWITVPRHRSHKDAARSGLLRKQAPLHDTGLTQAVEGWNKHHRFSKKQRFCFQPGRQELCLGLQPAACLSGCGLSTDIPCLTRLSR